MTATVRPIKDLVPHAGSMVLLETVETADALSISCLTGSHRAASNPLRRDGILPAVCAAEYGAQAAAVHGALNGRDGGGFLAAIKNLHTQVRRLDDVAGPLRVSARQVLADAGAIIYSFTVTAAEPEGSPAAFPLAEGQVTIFLTGGGAS